MIALPLSPGSSTRLKWVKAGDKGVAAESNAI